MPLDRLRRSCPTGAGGRSPQAPAGTASNAKHTSERNDMLSFPFSTPLQPLERLEERLRSRVEWRAPTIGAARASSIGSMQPACHDGEPASFGRLVRGGLAKTW